MQKQKKMKKGKNSGSVVIGEKQYKELISRPKQSTLQRDARQGKLRKGKRSNPYLQTLLDPVKVSGVKVPDVTSFPTATFQTYQRYDVATGASPTSVAYIFQPILKDFYANCTNLNGATAYSNWNSATDYNAIANVIHSIRPVSGLIRVYTTASSTSNQGELYAVMLPPGQAVNATDLGTTNLIAQRFAAYRTPLKTGVDYLWMPLDPKSRIFSVAISDATNQQVNDNYPAVLVAWDGVAATTDIIIEVWFNWECVPEFSTWNLFNPSAPYISSSDSEEATGVMTRLASYGRAFGEDLGAWLLDQGAIAAGQIGTMLASSATHYVTSRVGRSGQYGTSVY